MAKKITIQHLYTTGTTAAPAASAITLGEIAISAGKGSEGIYFKNNNDEVVNVLTSAQTRTMILETAGSVEGFNDHIEHLANNRPKNEGNNPYGHVKLVDGDLSGKYQNYYDAGDGVAASAYHFHKQYYSFLDSGKGLTTIIDNVNHPNEIGFGIDDVTYNQITGATPSSTFNAHTGNTEIHVTKTQKEAWDTAANRINTFLDVETGATEALDSLHEIQEYLTGSGNSVNTLLDSLNNLTDTVSRNTDDITNLKQNFEDNGTVSVLQSDVQRKVETIDVSGNLSATTGTTSTGSGVKKYTITHTPASTQSSAITATNTTTDLSFGSAFTIVDKIGYDANGHVVSGSTQTLTLPNLPAADEDTAGIVKIKSGELGIEYELLPNPTGIAADVCHYHSQYVKYFDLSNYKGSEPLVISCGTY